MKILYQTDNLLTLDRASLRRIAFFSLALIFCVHAFCFFNPTYSGASVMINTAKGTAAQTEAGLWLQPFYFAVRGAISAPLAVGLLSTLYLTAAALIIADLLAFKHACAQLLLVCVLSVNPYVLSIFASSLHTADALLLAQLFAAAGIWLGAKLRFGFLPAACLIGAALALDAGAAAFAVVLIYLFASASILDSDPIKPLILRMIRLLIALMFGMMLHRAGYAVLLRLRGLDGAAAMQGTNAASAWLVPIRALLSPLTAYPDLSVALRALLSALSLIALITYGIQESAYRAVILAVFAIFLPAQAALPIFSSEPSGQFMAAYPLLDLLPILLVFRVFGRHRALYTRLTAAALAVLTLGVSVFSHQVYLKKNLEAQSTLSVMTRIIHRVEQMEGFSPGYTPVAFVGSLEDSPLSVERIGFEHLSSLDAARHHYAVTGDEDMIWYSWEILGYPFSFVSYHDLAQISRLDEVQAMPVFPAKGSCAYVGDTLVVKLSETD